MPDVLNITNIPAPRVEFIDSRTGLMSREWYRFFLNLFMLTGSGSNATTLEDLQVESPYESGLASLTQALTNFSQSVEVQVADTKAQQALSSIADLTNLVNASALAPRYDASLDDLGDVTLTTPANNNVLSYYPSARAWRNTDPGVLYAAAYGVSASNTAAQNTAAFAAIAAAGPGRYILPAGLIQIDDTITLPSYQTWQGAGIATTTLKWTSTSIDGCIKSKDTTCVGLYGMTLDDNNLTTHTSAGVLSFNSIVDFVISDVQIINMFKYGMGVDSCNTGSISNFEIIKNSKTLTQNQAINVSRAAYIARGNTGTYSANLVFRNGTCRNSAILSIGEDIWFENINIYGWSFGAGIVIEVGSNRGGILNCMATDGTGVDSPTGYRAGGFEVWGVSCVVIGVSAVANDGMGIDWGSENGILANSYCANNGRGSTLYSGISARYGSGGIAKASGSMIVGCRCVDTGAGTQKYGYTEESALLSNITVMSCSFIGNTTAPMQILSSTTFTDIPLNVSQSFAGATIVTGSYGAQSATLPGVNFGDFIQVGFSFPLLNCSATAFVTATNSVQCVFYNNTGASVTLAAGTIYFRSYRK